MIALVRARSPNISIGLPGQLELNYRRGWWGKPAERARAESRHGRMANRTGSQWIEVLLRPRLW